MHLRSQPVLTALLLGAMSIGCASGPVEIPEGAQPVAVQPIPEDPPRPFFSSLYEDPQRLVIRDSSTWASAWLQIIGHGTPVQGAPKIDFETQVVILAAMGTQPGGGFTIEIDDVRIMDRDAWITVTQTLPGRWCAVPAIITSPVVVVAVPRFSGRATFVEVEKERDCRE